MEYGSMRSSIDPSEERGVVSTGGRSSPATIHSWSSSNNDNDDDPTLNDNGTRVFVCPEYDDSGDFGNSIKDSSFENLDVSISGQKDKASKSLKHCEKYVVNPFNVLLQVVGWRPFECQCGVFNRLYPGIIFIMLMLACIAQVLTCYSRTNSTPPTKVVTNDNSTFYVLQCESHVVTLNFLPYLLKLSGYLVALYVFRIAHPENLSKLAKTVFYNDVASTRSRRDPVSFLIFIMALGACYFIMSAIFSLIRMVGFRLYSPHTIPGWFIPGNATSDPSLIEETSIGFGFLSYFLWIITFLGFMFFDLLYVAVVINYCSQCQLLTFLIDITMDKVRNKKFSNLYEAAREIRKLDEFFGILNGSFSLVVNLVVYTFLANVILSYVNVTRTEGNTLSICIGFLNLFQWIMISLIPVLIALRSTASGNELRRLGQEIATRPFYYSDTPDLELQFFLTFTQSTKYQVNLAFIPMQPPIVYGSIFVILVLISSGIVIPQVQSVTWI